MLDSVKSQVQRTGGTGPPGHQPGREQLAHFRVLLWAPCCQWM